jgi:hypothetical protein
MQELNNVAFRKLNSIGYKFGCVVALSLAAWGILSAFRETRGTQQAWTNFISFEFYAFIVWCSFAITRYINSKKK